MKKEVGIIFAFLLSLFFISMLQINFSSAETYYSTNQSAPFHIERLFPYENWESESLEYFLIKSERTGFCNVYTNKTGSWSSIGEEVVMENQEHMIIFSLTTPGSYEWNLQCQDIERNNTIKAHKRNIPFKLIEPEPEELEQNESQEPTVNNSEPLENNSIDVDLNESINNSQDGVVNQSDEQNNTTDDSQIPDSDDQEIDCDDCLFDSICYERGVLHEINGEKMFCDEETNELLLQKDEGLVCTENFECLTDYCLNGFCRKNSFWNKLLSMFGLI